MWLQIKVKNEKSSFIIELLKQLKDSIEDIQILEEDEAEKYFEVVDAEGTYHKIKNWTDEEFEIMGLREFFNNQEEVISVERLFDV